MAELPEALCRVSYAVENMLRSYESSKDPDALDCLIFQVVKLKRLLLVSETCSCEILENVCRSLSLLEHVHEMSTQENVQSYVTQVQNSDDHFGRPRLNIRKEQLEYLLSLGFSCVCIAAIIGVSLSTVRRRMTEYGLSITALYSNISDQELDSVISQIKHEFPNCGYRMTQGHLFRQGYRISQIRVRESLHRIDPEGVAIRWTTAVQRRKYSVFSPLSLWHIDGNHKLIRWRLVVHGGVDGYSRIPVYLCCSANNRADTVLQLFVEAVHKYGLPSRVRCDKGVENVSVSLFIISHPLRGPGRGSVIVGRSVHNQRIERMWKDVYQGVLRLYYDLFHYLESTHMLDPNNDIHLFCLHYIFIPRINKHLNAWKEAWNKHPLRSEHNFTPEQLWIAGLQHIAGSTSNIAKEVFESIDENESVTYGIDWEGPISTDESEDNGGVTVPETECPITADDMTELQSTIHPLSASNEYGIDLYESTIAFVSQKATSVS